MNRVNVQQARDAMQRVIDENRLFNMNLWSFASDSRDIQQPFECGYAGCLLGTCWIDKRVVGFGQTKARPKFNLELPHGENSSLMLENFSRWLGLTWNNTNTLCTNWSFYDCSEEDFESIQPQQVVEKLDELLDGSSLLK